MTKDILTEQLSALLEDFKVQDDPLLEMMKYLLGRIMELEISQRTGSEKGEHNPERTGYRSGTRNRRLDTRLGTIDLEIPKLRKGGYVPFFMERWQRSEQALVSVVVEAYRNGVSTRKIQHLAQSLGIRGISASEVSEMNKGLDGMVESFRTRSLESEYPVIWVDALYENIREDNRIEGKAVMVVKAVNLEGKPDIIAVEVMENESEDTYLALFNNLKARGVEKVWLCVSDAHKGLKAAIRKAWTGLSWQRCKVHFMRNILAHVPQRQKEEFASRLKLIWQAPDAETARKLKDDFVVRYGSRFPKAVQCLEEGFEDSIQYYSLELLDPRKISSTNTLERLNEEIRRRTRVVGIFPSMESYIRLVTSYLIEYIEDKLSGASYMKAETLKQQKELLESRKVA